MNDLTLLKKLYDIEVNYKNEHKMINFIINYCYKELNKSQLYFEIDHYGNLFITKNTNSPNSYVCIIAHMDTVQNYKTKRNFYFKNDKIYAKYIDNNNAGLGSDDKNGIFVALKLLKEIDNIKCCFTVEEETGGNGAFEASLNFDFFSNVMYLIQADRHGCSDFITHTNGIDCTSNQFINRISKIIVKYNYKTTKGIFTDVGILSEELKISGVNVSCGYYHEHTEIEFTKYSELLNCYYFIKDIILETKDEDQFYPIEIKKSKLDNKQYFIPCDYCKDFDCLKCNFDFNVNSYE